MKSRTELESDLENAERQLAPACHKLDQLVKQFAVSIVPDVESWIKKEAVHQIQENHVKVNEAGVEFVRDFKADVTSLLGDINSICVNALGQSDKWPHNKNLTQQDLYTSGQNDFFSEVFKRAVSSLGNLLDKHKLIDDRDQNRSWRRAHPKGYEYSYHPGFDGRKYDEVSTYRNLLKTHWELKQSISRLKVDIEKAKTRDLWDEV